jgi:PPOX class probable F420-dependent enzyme
MRLERDAALIRFRSARVASLATTRPSGAPHVVPVTFAVVDEVIFTMVDSKPKTTTALQRLDNITANPHVSMLVDHYEEDWTALWWVRVDGSATVSSEDDDLAIARSCLQEKYSQYRDQPPPGPAIRIEITAVSSWEWTR